MRMKIINLFFLCLSIFALPASAFAQSAVKDGTPRYVQIRAVPEFDKVKPGQTLTLALDQKMVEHWHTYWKNPGDSGESTRITWTLPEGFTAGEIQWPVPERISIGPLTNFGYNNSATLLVDINVPDKIYGPTVPVKADLEWLVCSDICVPEATTIELNLPVAATDETVTATDPALFAKARAAIPQNVAWQGMVEETNGSLVLTFTPDAEILPKLDTGKTVFFPEEWGLIQNAAAQGASIEDGKIKIKMVRDTRALTDVPEIKGVIASETEDGSRFGYTVSTAVSHIPAAAPVANIVSAEPAPDKSAPDATINAPHLQDVSFMKALVLALLGGLVLNLMPCVFPILSMKAVSMVTLSAKEKSHAAIYGLSYTAGILVCFGIIAGGLLALQLAGNHIGWGFQLQNPIVVLLLAYLLFVIGLNLSGFFDFNINGAGNFGQKWTQRHGYAGSFFTGVLATIVATPCTAPFMGIALGYALLQPPMVAFAIFMSLGLGLALPYLLLCIIPPLRKVLPKPGLWMETFRQFLSFPMYASAAWLIWVYNQQVQGMYDMLLAMIGLVLIAFGIWLFKRQPKRNLTRMMIRAMGVFALIVAVLIAAFSIGRMPLQVAKLETQTAAQDASTPEHKAFSQSALDAALQGKDPVFVNMTASWCITCKVNERIALATEETRDLFRKNNVVYLQGDWTNQNPEITDFLKTHGRNGVPLYVYYGPRDPTTNQRPEAVVLPQLLTTGLVADIITNQ